jgi:hypothetical protein
MLCCIGQWIQRLFGFDRYMFGSTSNSSFRLMLRMSASLLCAYKKRGLSSPKTHTDTPQHKRHNLLHSRALPLSTSSPSRFAACTASWGSRPPKPRLFWSSTESGDKVFWERFCATTDFITDDDEFFHDYISVLYHDMGTTLATWMGLLPLSRMSSISINENYIF